MALKTDPPASKTFVLLIISCIQLYYSILVIHVEFLGFRFLGSFFFFYYLQSSFDDSFGCGKHDKGYRLEVKGTNPRKDWFNGRFRDVLLTSIAVVPVQEHTVATLGTADGRVIQVRRNR